MQGSGTPPSIPAGLGSAGTDAPLGRDDTPHPATGRPREWGSRLPQSRARHCGLCSTAPRDSSSSESGAALGEGGRTGPPPSPISRRRRVFSGLPSRTCVSSSGLKLAASRSLRRSWFMVATRSGGGRGRSAGGGSGGSGDGCPQLRPGPALRAAPGRREAPPPLAWARPRSPGPAPARPGPPRPAPSPSPPRVGALSTAAEADTAPAWAR